MDYGRPALADRLAAEYVVGTLRGPAKRRFEALLPAHPSLRAAVRAWEQRLMPLMGAVTPVKPHGRVWARIEQRVFGAAAAPVSWWQRLALWRSVAAFASVAALALGVVLMQPPPPAVPIVIVLGANPGAAGAPAASFVASLTPDGRALALKPLDAIALDAGRALELWSVPGSGAPRSLGLVRADRATTVLRAKLLDGTAAFAVSLEPEGGSPTGAPTGPILSLGKLES